MVGLTPERRGEPKTIRDEMAESVYEDSVTGVKEKSLVRGYGCCIGSSESNGLYLAVAAI